MIWECEEEMHKYCHTKEVQEVGCSGNDRGEVGVRQKKIN